MSKNRKPILIGIFLIVAGILIALFVPGLISAVGGLVFAIGAIITGISIFTSKNGRQDTF